MHVCLGAYHSLSPMATRQVLCNHTLRACICGLVPLRKRIACLAGSQQHPGEEREGLAGDRQPCYKCGGPTPLSKGAKGEQECLVNGLRILQLNAAMKQAAVLASAFQMYHMLSGTPCCSGAAQLGCPFKLKVVSSHCSTCSAAAHELPSVGSPAVCLMKPYCVCQLPFLRQPMSSVGCIDAGCQIVTRRKYPLA